MRPHIHIEDMTDLYLWAVMNERVSGIFNAGFENRSVLDVAKIIKGMVRGETKIISLPSLDPRSYRLNSDKILNAGFKPKFRVVDAIQQLGELYYCGELKNELQCYNIEVMKRAA